MKPQRCACVCMRVCVLCDENASNQFTKNDDGHKGSKYSQSFIHAGKNGLMFEICIAFVATARIISLIE